MPVPIDSLFDYSIPEEMDRDVQQGCRVLVSFSGRPMTGVVVARDCVAEDPGRTLSKIERIIDFEPALSTDLLEILTTAAADVLCPIGIAMATALPSGSTPRFRNVLGLTERGRAALRSGAVPADARALLERLDAEPLPENTLGTDPETLGRIREWLSDGLIVKGKREHAPVARAAMQSVVALKAGMDVLQICETTLARAPKQAELLRQIEQLCAGPEANATGEIPLDALKQIDPRSAALVRNLRDRGLVITRRQEVERNVLGAPVDRENDLPLTDDQQQALSPIEKSLHSDQSEIFLLHGVTGSGENRDLPPRRTRDLVSGTPSSGSGPRDYPDASDRTSASCALRRCLGGSPQRPEPERTTGSVEKTKAGRYPDCGWSTERTLRTFGKAGSDRHR